jgi:hypothetical protein
MLCVTAVRMLPHFLDFGLKVFRPVGNGRRTNILGREEEPLPIERFIFRELAHSFVVAVLVVVVVMAATCGEWT